MESGLVLAALSALHDVCRNTERNRDAFIHTNMDQVWPIYPICVRFLCSRGQTAVVVFVVFGMNDCCDSSKAVAEPESPGRRCSRSRACFDERGSPMVLWVYLADNNETELRENGRRGSAGERACKRVVWEREHAERTREKRHGDRVERTGNVCELMFPGTDVRYFVPHRLLRAAYISCLFDSRQLTSLLLRWTNALGDGDGEAGGEDDDCENSTVGDAASAKGKAMLVAAGLKTVRIVCTKADNNKGN